MRFTVLVVTALVTSMIPFRAWAFGDGDLWGGAAAMVCVAQNPALSKTALGGQLSEIPEFAAAVNGMRTAGAACFKQKQWLSPQLCNALLKQDPESKGDLSSLSDKYGAEIGGLIELFACMESKQSPQPAKK